MLLTELLCTDGADFDWTPYLPILLHTCLTNFDNTKQLIGEHAKKLFLNILHVLTIQCELYELTEYLLNESHTVLDNQSIIFDRKYTNNNYVDSANPIMASMYNSAEIANPSTLSVGNCHYNYLYNSRVFPNLNGKLFNEKNSSTNRHRQLVNMSSAPVSPYQTNHLSSESSPPKNIKKTKRAYRLEKAKECLNDLIQQLAKSKNNPVWPFELVTSHNYIKKLTSVQLINEFVSNLKLFLLMCANVDGKNVESMPRTGLARSNSLNDRVEHNLESVCNKVSLLLPLIMIINFIKI